SKTPLSTSASTRSNRSSGTRTAICSVRTPSSIPYWYACYVGLPWRFVVAVGARVVVVVLEVVVDGGGSKTTPVTIHSPPCFSTAIVIVRVSSNLSWKTQVFAVFEPAQTGPSQGF